MERGHAMVYVFCRSDPEGRSLQPQHHIISPANHRHSRNVVARTRLLTEVALFSVFCKPCFFFAIDQGRYQGFVLRRTKQLLFS